MFTDRYVLLASLFMISVVAPSFQPSMLINALLYKVVRVQTRLLDRRRIVLMSTHTHQLREKEKRRLLPVAGHHHPEERKRRQTPNY